MTAEIAVALPSLLLVVLVLLVALAGVLQMGRNGDAARSVARQLARGDDPATTRARALTELPAGSSITVDPTDGASLLRVTVRTPERVPPVLRAVLPAHDLTAVAVAAIEQDSSSSTTEAPAVPTVGPARS